MLTCRKRLNPYGLDLAQPHCLAVISRNPSTTYRFQGFGLQRDRSGSVRLTAFGVLFDTARGDKVDIGMAGEP